MYVDGCDFNVGDGIGDIFVMIIGVVVGEMYVMFQLFLKSGGIDEMLLEVY